MLERRRTLLSVSLFSGLFLLWGINGAIGAFQSVPGFKVSLIEVRWPSAFGSAQGWPEGMKVPNYFRIIPPTSIFKIHLEAVSRALQQQFPTAEVEQVQRILPNRLIATMRPRNIIAQVYSQAGYFPVSDDGVVVGQTQAAIFPRLPVLFLQGVQGPYQIGQALGGAGFWAASELLTAIDRQGGIRGHRVAVVKVDEKNLLIFLDSGLEIRFAQDQLSSEWQRLWELVAQHWETLRKARYVDLRFEDPVIGS